VFEFYDARLTVIVGWVGTYQQFSCSAQQRGTGQL